ncbi:MAG TPA: hypothetical protein VMN36_17370 [Verrucomicrobiales bacterium]|nr:hypothetical protein [Verrucomicrobiales bacterium]
MSGWLGGLLLLAAGPALRAESEPAAEPPAAEAEAEAEAEAPKRNAAYFHYALFFAPEPSASLGIAADRLLGDAFQNAFRPAAQAATAAEGLFLHVRMVPTANYSVPPPTFLRQKGVGLSEDAIAALSSSREVCLLEFFAVEPKNLEYLARADRFAGELAKATGGFVWDEQTRQMFSAGSWTAHRIEEKGRPLIARHVVVHGGETDTGSFRAVTLGLRKLGYPDYVLEDVDPRWWTPLGRLLEFLIAEASRRGPFNPAPGYFGEELREAFKLPGGAIAPGLAFRDANPLEGDPNNQLWAVDFSTYPGRSPAERQGFLVQHLLEPDPSTLALRSRQQELLRLSEEARKLLREKRPQIEAGLPEGERLSVKARVDGEYRWLGVESWAGESLRGILEDEPGLESGRPKGAKAIVPAEEVFDYVHVHADGTREGDKTGELIRRISNPE